MTLLHSAPLPSLLLFADGSPVASAADWPRRRAEVAAAVLGPEYGGLPPTPPADAVVSDKISSSTSSKRFAGLTVTLHDYAVSIGGAAPLSFRIKVWTPAGDGSFPVVLNGDGCWQYLTDAILADALRRGFAIAQFNRCEFARDADVPRDHGVYRALPGDYGALAAWAWGYHRAVDALVQLPFVDAKRIAITGHSRGGKTVLIAAATDERIALVADNDSGCGGAGCYHVESDDCETIKAITTTFPYWFAKDFSKWAGREADMPFDQHFLKALVAPRPLLTQFALADAWANHPGTLATHEATAEVYRLLGAEDRLGIAFRNGGHGHQSDDWTRFLDFAEKNFGMLP